MKTVSLSLAIQLKEAGYPEEGSYAWYIERHYIGNFNGENPRIECIPADMFNKNLHQKISDTWVANAPTADEILDQFLNFSYQVDFVIRYYEDGVFFELKNPELKEGNERIFGINRILHKVWLNVYGGEEKMPETLADAAAKMWLSLKKERLL